MKKYENHLIAVLSLLSLTFLIYIGSTLTQRLKADLTQEGLYTLTKGTKDILGKLRSPMKIKLFYSKTAANKGTEGLRQFNTYFYFVKDLLEEYVDESHNNLSLEVIDPRPDTKEEEEAMTFGLKRFYLSETESYFFGLVVINSGGKESTIEFLDPKEQENLEYQLSKMIYNATGPDKKTVGVLSSLEVYNENLNPYMAQIMRMQGKEPQDSWMAIKMLQEQFDLKTIEPTVSEIGAIDLLLVIHPKGFSQQTLFAIDQFVLKGGKAVVLVDGHSIIAQSMNPAMAMQRQGTVRSEIDQLLKSWGVELENNKLVADRALAARGSIAPNMPPTRLLPILRCNHTCTESYKDVISSKLKDLLFVYPGSLIVLDKNNKQVTPLIATTAKGNSFNVYGPELANPASMDSSFTEGSEPRPLAYKIVGQFKSAYPSGVDVENEETDAKGNKKKVKSKLTGLTESKKDGAVIVVADVDFLHDQFSFQRTILGAAMANDNAKFFLNAIESLSGDTSLLNIRSKGRYQRGFDVIDRIEAASEVKTKNKVNAINAQIAKFQDELRQMSQVANKENISLIRSEGVEKRKELQKQVALLKQELRDVKREGRESIEGLGKMLQLFNTVFIPFILFVVGIWVYNKKAKQLS